MDISDLFDGIMKSINRFADPSACGHAQAGETAEQRSQEKTCLRQMQRGRQVQGSGRGPEHGSKNTEDFQAKEKRDMTDYPKRE